MRRYVPFTPRMSAGLNVRGQVDAENAIAYLGGGDIVGAVCPPVRSVSLGKWTMSSVDFAEVLVVRQSHGFSRSNWVSKKLWRAKS